jgi:hypothetical protein
MKRIPIRRVVLLFFFLLLLSVSGIVNARMTKGIYITQGTLEDTKRITYLIQRAKKAGIDTFIIDFDRPSKQTETNIALVKSNNIIYVARIVMFPDGGTREQIRSEAYWQKRYKLVEQAVAYGAQQIQLDYIRYNTKQPALSQNSIDVHNIIKWYKNQLAKQSIPLQVDVFGIASFGEEKHIGQNIKLFSQTADVVCPMVYPSHYEPFREHAVAPYNTVYKSLASIKAQFPDNKTPFKLNPYIELSNYRYPLSQDKKLAYIYAQIKAVEEAGADGWYAWSPHNQYDSLFRVLETRKVQ